MNAGLKRTAEFLSQTDLKLNDSMVINKILSWIFRYRPCPVDVGLKLTLNLLNKSLKLNMNIQQHIRLEGSSYSSSS